MKEPKYINTITHNGYKYDLIRFMGDEPDQVDDCGHFYKYKYYWNRSVDDEGYKPVIGNPSKDTTIYNDIFSAIESLYSNFKNTGYK